MQAATNDRTSKLSSIETAYFKKLFIGSIPTKTRPLDLLQQLKKVAKDIELASTHTGETINAGFSIISCKHESTYKMLLENSIYFYERLLDIKPFKEGSELEKHKDVAYRKRIVIDNLPNSIDESDLSEFFSRFGKLEKKAFILKIKHFKHRDKISGHVLFKELSDAKQALSKKTAYIKNEKVFLESYDQYLARKERKQSQKETISKRKDFQPSVNIKTRPEIQMGRGTFKKSLTENETSTSNVCKPSPSESSNRFIKGLKDENQSHTEQRKGTLIEFNKEDRLNIRSKLLSTLADLEVNHRYQNLRFNGRLNFAAGYNLQFSV